MKNTSRNNEFKIQLSIEDINKLDKAIREMSNNSNIPEKSKPTKAMRKAQKKNIKKAQEARRKKK